MSLNAKNRSEKGFKMHKSLQIWEWFLPKKIDLPTQEGGGVEVGILGGQKIKSPGNVMNCPEINTICFYPSHPGGFQRGGWGSKFQKFGKFHELSRKSRKKFYPPPLHQRGWQWEF